MSNANLNANSFRDKFDKTGGFLSGNTTIKDVWPAYIFENSATGKQWQIELSDINPTTNIDGSLYITEDGVKNHARFHPNGDTELFANLRVHGDITSRGTLLEVATDQPNAHVWFKNASGVERAIIWHEGTSNQLKFRVGSSNDVAALEKNGSFWSKRFISTDTTIGFHCQKQVTGVEGGLVRGEVQGGSWGQWRDRAAGVLVDCPQAFTGAHTLIKASQWGRTHLFAMDVHCPGDNVVRVKMHLEGGQGSEQFTFDSSGQAWAVGGWHTGSDIRFKEDIFPLTNPRTKEYTSWLDKVCKLTASSFRYKNSENRRIGFIAQDVIKIIPEAVSINIDTTSENKEERLFIDQVAIIAAQNEAIKELKNIVSSLQSRIELLEKP